MGIDISCILRYDMHSTGVKKAATLRRSSEILNIGFGELIVVLLVAFLIVGPKDLPKVARWLGRQVKMLRRMVAELKTETGWDEMEKELTQTQQELKQTQKDLGEVEKVDVTQSSGNAQYDSSAANAIWRTSRAGAFPPPPSEQYTELDLVFTLNELMGR